MVDFESNARVFGELGIKVVAASVDSVDRSADLVAGLRLKYVTVLANLDAPAVAQATGAALQAGERTFLHATGFLVNPAGEIVDSVYASGPIGRFTASEVLRKVAFERGREAG